MTMLLNELLQRNQSLLPVVVELIPDEAELVECSDPLRSELPAISRRSALLAPGAEVESRSGRMGDRNAGMTMLLNELF